VAATQQDSVGYRFQSTSQQRCNNSAQLQHIPWRPTHKFIHHPGIFSGADQNHWRMILHMCHRAESRKYSHWSSSHMDS